MKALRAGIHCLIHCFVGTEPDACTQFLNLILALSFPSFSEKIRSLAQDQLPSGSVVECLSGASPVGVGLGEEFCVFSLQPSHSSMELDWGFSEGVSVLP